MDADERLTALKKAYADIILNTAKEAAARIMASERKTLRFQHELYVSKEEALQMLLRLKQMMNSTISEAAVRSLSQQKKIDELEAQLQEAEDIVKDLRQELREVQAELERVKSNNEQDLDERYNIASKHESVTVSETNIFNSNEGLRCFNQLINTGQHSYVTNPDLPSIIVRTKEPELYRNGCTQRIRACERNTLDRELSPSNDVKHETSVKEAGDDERICAVPTHESGNMCNIEKKGVTNEGGGLSSWYKVLPVKSIRRKRKRAFRFGKKRAPRPAKYTTKCEEEPSQMDPTLSLDATKTRSRLDYTETAEGDVEIMDALDVQSVKQNGSRESSGVPACKMELEKVGVALVNSESKASDTTNGIPSQPVNDRVIKYTFQRKRKRAAMSSSDGSAPAEKSNLTRNTGDKQNGSLEPQKLVPLAESSRDSRRLAQVARQLISLSEKKWWQ